MLVAVAAAVVAESTAALDVVVAIMAAMVAVAAAVATRAVAVAASVAPGLERGAAPSPSLWRYGLCSSA